MNDFPKLTLADIVIDDIDDFDDAFIITNDKRVVAYLFGTDNLAYRTPAEIAEGYENDDIYQADYQVEYKFKNKKLDETHLILRVVAQQAKTQSDDIIFELPILDDERSLFFDALKSHKFYNQLLERV